MALGETTNRIYLSVGFGRLRKKAEKGDVGAIERTSKDGTKLYAVEYKYVTGNLENVLFRDDEKYGKSWILQMKDGDEHYGIQFSENSRYASDLLKRIPNMHRNQQYTIMPYDFEADGKRKVGLSIKNMAGEKVESYYEKFTKTPEGGTWEYLYGFPAFPKGEKNKDRIKIYFMELMIFLRERALKHIGENFKKELEPEIQHDNPDDLPWEHEKKEDDIPDLTDNDLSF